MTENLSFTAMLLGFSLLTFISLNDNINSKVIPVVTVSETEDPNKNEITCLANNIYHEARDQPLRGKIAVTNVVLNRTHSGDYPNTPCKVIEQKNQFSWVPSKQVITDRYSYKDAYVIAENVYYGKYVDITKGSLYYHAKNVKPYWSKKMKRTMIISDHVFYRDV